MLLWVGGIVYLSQHDELQWLEKAPSLASSTLHSVQTVANLLLVGAATPRISEAVDHMEEEVAGEKEGSVSASHLDKQEQFWDKQGQEESQEKMQPKQQEGAANAAASADHNLHVIFSTDCTDYQNWQSITLFYSTLLVGQQGRVTRIASGCSDTEQTDLTSTYSKLFVEHFRTPHSSQPGHGGLTFRVHFTPDFKHDAKSGKKYAFYNKPRGLQHWLANAVPAGPQDEVVALLDPDMIFLRPLTAEVASATNKLYNKKLYVDKKTGAVLKPMQDYVKTGYPVAQRYGLGAPWTDDHHKKFNRLDVCGEGSPCMDVKEQEGEEYYSVGPPYIATRADFDRISTSWVEFVPRVHSQYPFLLAEMYAYSMAAAHERLPHAIMYHYMVSNADGGGEGWDFVDDLSDVCEAPSAPATAVGAADKDIPVERFYADAPMPVLFHYCQHFKITEQLSFYKGAHRSTIMTCKREPFPLCLPGTEGLGIDYKQHKRGTDAYRAERKKKRGGFAVNVIHRVLNGALAHFQKRMC